MTDAQVSLAFSGAVDESTDPRHLPPGTLVSATNGVFDSDGQLQVRYGYTMLNTPPSSIFRLAVFAAELIAITLAGVACTYSVQDGFDERDTTTPIGVTHAPLTSNTAGFAAWTIADANGYRVVAWSDANFVLYATVYDQATGAIVITATGLLGLVACAIAGWVLLHLQRRWLRP